MASRSPRLRRLLTRTTIALCIGLLTSIAVAWYFALRPDHSLTSVHGIGVNVSPEGLPSLQANYDLDDEYRPGFRRIEIAASSTPITPLAASRVRAELEAHDLNPHETGGMHPSQRPRWFGWVPFVAAGDPPMKRVSARAAGWPWLCMKSTFVQETAAVPILRGALPLIPETAYKTAATDPDRGALPLLPIWPGLLANTLLYAAPWLLLMLIVPAARRALRLRRGQCPACGYDLRATPTGSPCPECGQPALHR